MSDSLITVENLSKRYIIDHEREAKNKTLRDVVTNAAMRASNRLLHPLNGATSANGHREEFWALKDVSFEVKQGEVVGIIGRNGAGKSTLLKILSRITEPTAGRVRIKGRVASLLEVGTGFHPELTGRENVFLNGAVLGMSREEIKRKFDEIVAFAEIEKFLDTPVKRYSSGMYVRLAFAVAAHLEPEILIIDEVLAVGDYEFQRRCLGRMNQVAHSGRTVLFVSHNMTAIEDLCSQSIFLKNGMIECAGPTQHIVAYYLTSSAGNSVWQIDEQTEREGTGNARITQVELLASDSHEPLTHLTFRQSFRLCLHYRALKRLVDPRFGFAFLSDKGERVFLTETIETNLRILALEEGEGRFECLVSSPNLLPGVYYLEAWIIEQVNVSFADHLYRLGRVEISVNAAQEEPMTYLTDSKRGRVFMDCQWSKPDWSEKAILSESDLRLSKV
jgi:lipopolysaccharide transport system ATP-binding protein